MNENLQREYKNYVKCLNKVIKDAKIKYEEDLIEKNSGNSRQLGKIINKKLGNKGKKDNNISEISLRGTKKSQFLYADEEKPVSPEKSHSMGTFLVFFRLYWLFFVWLF